MQSLTFDFAADFVVVVEVDFPLNNAVVVVVVYNKN